MTREKPNRVAVITGAGSGVGRAAALALLARGYRVVLCGRRMDPLLDTARISGVAGDGWRAVRVDVTRPEEVDHLFRCALEHFGRVDILFNNAGISGPAARFEDIRVEEWQDVVAVNLTGAFLVAQGAFRAMKAQSPQGGRIINNGSVSAHAPRPDTAPYCATKHAITGLTKALSLDGRTYDIACGQIDIGNAATDMSDGFARGVLQADGRVAAEPRMSVDHVGEAIAYMADLPLAANVQFMTLMATKMPYIARG